MRKILFVFCFVMAVVFSFQTVSAQDSATPEEVYDLVLKAYPVCRILKRNPSPPLTIPKVNLFIKTRMWWLSNAPPLP